MPASCEGSRELRCRPPHNPGGFAAIELSQSGTATPPHNYGRLWKPALTPKAPFELFDGRNLGALIGSSQTEMPVIR